MKNTLGRCTALGLAVACSSCTYDPPKDVPTVTLNVKADSLSVLLKVCQGGRWASTGTLANSKERPIEHKTLFVHPVNEYSVTLPANQDIKLDFVGFGGVVAYNTELFCDDTVQLHTGPGGRFQADMYDVNRQFCSVRISRVLDDGTMSVVRDVKKITQEDCHG